MKKADKSTKVDDPDKIVKQAAGKKKKKKGVKSTEDNDPEEIVKQAAGQKADKSTDQNRDELVKQAAGQMTSATSIAKVFLDDRFPEWKEDNKTYMIPPTFKARDSHHQIGITETEPYTDSGDNGESIIYELLRRFGNEKKMGMFVINGLTLHNIKSWKIYSLLELPQHAETDFIIFHHRLGLIFIEVKNTSKKNIKRQINIAKDQLKGYVDLIKKFSEPRMEVLSNDATRDASNHLYKFSIPYKKVIALPSKVYFNPQSLDPDTSFLLKDDCRDLASFQKWWDETIERDATEMSVETQDAYKQALSTSLMIRHLCPVTETEGIDEIHKSLVSFNFHGTQKSKPFPQLMEDEYPFLWRWCRDVHDQKIKRDPSLREEEEKSQEEKKLQESFRNKHKLDEKDLREGKGMTLLNTLLKNRKYIEGDKYSPIDDAISAVFEDHYCLFYKNILRYTNTMREMVPDINEQQVATKVKQQEVLPENKNQEFLPDIKGLVLLETNNQDVLPEIKDQEEIPEIEDQEVLPEIKDQEVSPEIKDQEEIPEIKDQEVLSQIKDQEVLSEIKDQEVLSEIKDQEVSPEIKDQEEIPEIKDQEVLPEIKDQEEIPEIQDQEVLPAIKDQEVSPEINDQEVLSEIKDQEVSPEIKDQEEIPEIKDQEVLPEIKDQEEIPEIQDQEVLPAIKDQEVSPEINDQEVLPEIKDQEVLPEIKDQEGSPEIKDQEEIPEIKDQEVSPEIKDQEVLPEIKDQEVLPETKDQELLPAMLSTMLNDIKGRFS